MCFIYIIIYNLKAYFASFFKRFYLFIFRKRGGEGEREEEKHQCVVALHTPHTGDLARNLSMCPDWELNLWPFGLQSRAQSTESYQPGLFCFLFTNEEKRCERRLSDLVKGMQLSVNPSLTQLQPLQSLKLCASHVLPCFPWSKGNNKLLLEDSCLNFKPKSS